MEITADEDLEAGLLPKETKSRVEDFKEKVKLDNEWRLQIKPDIVTNILQPAIKDEIATQARWRARWYRLGNLFESFSVFFSGISAGLAFASGFFEYPLLAFIAGCVATLVTISMKYSTHAHKEGNERTRGLNLNLAHLELQGFDELEQGS